MLLYHYTSTTGLEGIIQPGYILQTNAHPEALVPGTKFFFKKAMVKASIGELSPPTQFVF